MAEQQLTHLDECGNIHMVDVTNRAETERGAVAKMRVRMLPQTVRLIETNAISKGSVLEVAKIAGIMVAKQTPQLIPICHPLPMTHIDVQFALDSAAGIIDIETRTRTHYKTGVDVEAFMPPPLPRSPFTTCAKAWTPPSPLNRVTSP